MKIRRSMKTPAALVLVALFGAVTTYAQGAGPLPPAGSPAPTQTPPVPSRPAAAPPPAVQAAAAAGVVPPADYVIGPEDVLSIVFWREKDLSNDVIVRPDGRISIPLLNDVVAAGMTPDELNKKLIEQARRYLEDPSVTVVVKAINSRKVFVTGNVAKPGAYALLAPTTVLQLISMTGGLLEYADAKNILIMRTENGKPRNYRFNYKEVLKQKNLNQNIELKPNDTVIIP
jgi:polysaccharide export outer membrane protein